MNTNDIDAYATDNDAGPIALVCGTNRPGSVMRLVARFLEYQDRRLDQTTSAGSPRRTRGSSTPPAPLPVRS
ncbi:MAG TPA: hypothetical protein VF796_26235 [Humisphaera sp.]